MIVYTEKTSSTQKMAKDAIIGNKINDKIIIFVAKEQTDGSGRNGKHWVSPAGNLYTSIVFANNIMDNLQILPIITAIATDQALQITPYTQYKWPNDILINGKKTAGILVEKLMSYTIIGIGINLTYSPFIPNYLTTNLRAENLLNFEINEANLIDLATRIADKIIELDSCKIANIWNKKAYKINQQVTVKLHNQTEISGVFIGIDDLGQMLLESNNGTINKVNLAISF